MARKKQSSNVVGWVILGAMAFGIFQLGTAANRDGGVASAAKPARSAPATQAGSVPLSEPRFVNVASLNVRHTPSTSGALIMTLPRGTSLRVLDRRDGWLLVDLNPTLEGWVAERLTTVRSPQQGYMPPAAVTGLR